jgi:MFS family permease
VLLYLSWVLVTSALFVPFVLLPAFARQHGASAVAAASLLSVVGGTSVAGRVVLGLIGDRVAIVPLFKLTVLAMAMSDVLWLVSSSYASLVLFALILGLGYGSRITLAPGVLIEYFGVERLGVVLGMFFTASGGHRT